MCQVPHLQRYDPQEQLPNSVVVLDNVKMHHSVKHQLQAFCNHAGARLEWLP